MANYYEDCSQHWTLPSMQFYPTTCHRISKGESTHPGTGIYKSQLLTLFTYFCTHSSARFYRWCKRHSMTTKLSKSQLFLRLTVRIDWSKWFFWSCMSYLQEQAHRKLTKYYPKLVHFFQALKSSNCNENHPLFVQKHDRKSLTSKMVAGRKWHQRRLVYCAWFNAWH